MVKGIQKQVIVVHSPGEEIFDQAIFILKDNAQGISDEKLLQQAKQVLREGEDGKKPWFTSGPVWACGGAAVTGLIWLATLLL